MISTNLHDEWVAW